MSQFNVSLLIRGDGSDAEAALKRTGAAVDQLGQKAGQTTQKTTALGAAERKAATDAALLAAESKQAAGALTGLNAAAVSTTTGLRGALSQGARIGTVLGGAGAAGAVKNLGVGLRGLLDPMTFVAAAAISAGAAIIQAMTGAGQATLTLRERLDALGESVNQVRAISENYSAKGLQSMIDKYGEVDAAILLLIQRQNELAQAEALRNANSAVDGFLGEFGTALSGIDDVGRAAQLSQGIVRQQLGLSVDQAIALKDALEAARSAMSFEDKAAALATVSGLLGDSKIAGSELAAAILSAEDSMRQLAASAPDASWMSAAISGVVGLGAAIRARIGEALTLRGAAAQAAQGAAYSALLSNSGTASGPDAIRTGQFGGGRFAPPVLGAGLPAVKVSGGSGGGGGAARAEADAIGELIARLKGEIDLARESDPVQREMLRLRKDLTGATAAQRAEVETLIATREREKAAMEALNYVSEQAGDALIDALMGASGAGEKLIQTLARAVAQAAILGTGPLAGLFGGVGLFGATPGGGGFFGGLLGLFTKKAGGGWISGAGGPTDDRVPALLSNGEFVVRAAAAARNRATLEAINAGVPRFAGGGFAGGGPAFGAAGAGGGMSRVRLELGPGLVATILEQARDQSVEVVQTGLRSYDREALPARVAEISRDPRRRG